METILTAILSVITGGGIASIVTAKATRKKATAEAEQSSNAVWRELTAEIRGDVAALKCDIAKLKGEVSTLTLVVTSFTRCELRKDNPTAGCPVETAYCNAINARKEEEENED